MTISNDVLLRMLRVVSPELLDEGDRTSLAVPAHWSRLAFAGGSLTHTYSSPAIARLLVDTGRLTSTAPLQQAGEDGTAAYSGLVGTLTDNTAYQNTSRPRELLDSE